MDIYKTHRKAIESTYLGKCSVIGFVKEKDGSRTKTIENTIYKDIPCRLSRTGSRASTNETNINNEINYTNVLFVNPDVEIEAGSKIIIEQNNETREYVQSGEAFKYITHQEILVRRVDSA